MTERGSAHILVVEDEADLASLLCYNLESAGFSAVIADTLDRAREAVRRDRPDLILLDWMLPRGSGLDLCQSVRSDPAIHDIPIIMLTARGEEQDKVRGLDAGADDYVTKPFSPSELIARVRALLRRAGPRASDAPIMVGAVRLDPESHTVTHHGKPCRLGPTEYRMLRHFMQHPERVFSREELLEAVWGQEVFVEERTVDVHIRRLRKGLEVGGLSAPIRTVRSAGYALVADQRNLARTALEEADA